MDCTVQRTVPPDRPIGKKKVDFSDLLILSHRWGGGCWFTVSSHGVRTECALFDLKVIKKKVEFRQAVVKPQGPASCSTLLPTLVILDGLFLPKHRSLETEGGKKRKKRGGRVHDWKTSTSKRG